MLSRRALLAGILGAAISGTPRGDATTHSGVGAPMSGRGDPGLKLLQFVAANLHIDEAWIVREPRRFTWWGHRLAQRVWAEPPRRSEGVDVCRVHAETDLLRNVPDRTDLVDRLAALNGFASLSALVWDPGQRRLTLRCGAYVHAQNIGWLRHLFLAAVGIQVADAHIKAQGLGAVLGGEPDTSPHPRTGRRRRADETLGVIDQVFAPRGRGPSPFTEADFKAALQLEPRPWVLATGNGGLSAELPFLDDVPAILGGRGTALLVATAAERHPQLGSGALLRLSLPTLPGADPADARQGAQLAVDLNRAEPQAWAVAHFLGAWTFQPTHGLTFVTFLPAAVYRPRLLDALLWSMAARAQWARSYLSAGR